MTKNSPCPQRIQELIEEKINIETNNITKLSALKKGAQKNKLLPGKLLPGTHDNAWHNASLINIFHMNEWMEVIDA